MPIPDESIVPNRHHLQPRIGGRQGFVREPSEQQMIARRGTSAA
jgi:hypothetical protein